MNGAKWRVPQVPPGSSQVVACVKRSEKMDRSSKSGTLNSGGPGTEPAAVKRLPRAGDDQPIEDVIWSSRESDPPVVVRDGSAGHRAKEWAGSNASKGLTSGHVDPETRVNLPACKWKPVLALCVGTSFMCALPEEPGAAIPHAGICEGGVG